MIAPVVVCQHDQETTVSACTACAESSVPLEQRKSKGKNEKPLFSSSVTVTDQGKTLDRHST